MSSSDQGWNRVRSELLMDVIASLSEYTQQTDDFAKIPAYLRGVLQLDAISLALVREVKDGTHVVLAAASHPDTTGSLEQDMLTVYHQTRPLTNKDGPALRSTSDLEPILDVTEVPVQFHPEF